MIQIDGINKPKRCMTFNDLDTIERCPLLNESDDCSLIVALHDGFYEDATISWDEQYANCPLKEVTPAERKKGKWTTEEVAEILFNAFGDDCACNFNGIDEWLPERCKYTQIAGECPEPKEKHGCWMQFLLQGGGDMRGEQE